MYVVYHSSPPIFGTRRYDKRIANEFTVCVCVSVCLCVYSIKPVVFWSRELSIQCAGPMKNKLNEDLFRLSDLFFYFLPSEDMFQPIVQGGGHMHK